MDRFKMDMRTLDVMIPLNIYDHEKLLKFSIMYPSFFHWFKILNNHGTYAHRLREEKLI